MNKKNSVLALGVLLTAVALLFAPKAGIQTRKDIRRFSRKTVHQLDDFKCNLQDQINDGYSQVKRLLKTA